MPSRLAQNPDPRSRAFTDAGPRLDGRASKRAFRAAWTTLAVLAGSALALRAGDAVPGWIFSAPRGVHPCASLDEAEARTGLRLGKLRQGLSGCTLTIGAIRATVRQDPAIAIAMQDGDGKHQVTLFRSRGGTIPVALRPPLLSFHEMVVPLKTGLSASLKAERQADGSVWQDLEWSDGAHTTALRFKGRTVELLRLARQLAEDTP